jgi:putative transposase
MKSQVSKKNILKKKEFTAVGGENNSHSRSDSSHDSDSEFTTRKINYKICTRESHNKKLFGNLILHKNLYNAANQERIDCYKKTGRGINYFDQAKSLTEIRSFDDGYAGLNAQSCQATLKRLDRAYKNFFERCKSGKPGGFPRFKSIDRFKSFGFNAHGDGYKLIYVNGKLSVRISGIGTMKLLGNSRFDDKKDISKSIIKEPKSCEVIYQNGRWILSVSYKIKMSDLKTRASEKRISSSKTSFDWGVETFLTTFDGAGFGEVLNPRFYAKIKEKLTSLQQSLAKLKRGTRRYKQLKHQIGKLKTYEANCRLDFQHKLATKMVRENLVIATEELNIKNMTKSAAGTTEEPGKNVAQKSGLNREILATAPSQFIQLLKYKAEEAGTKIVEIDTIKYKPSQTCAECGKVEKKKLSEREHNCECGFKTSRDRNSALVIWKNVFKDFTGPERSALGVA